jgi:P-type Cu+ transporter
MHRAAATLKPIALGTAGAAFLLLIYFSILTLVSGWEFTLSQFVDFWYFIVSLAIGFGIQIGLYTYLRGAIHGQTASGKVVAVSGTTSTAAMISCCTHYLVNILPALGTAGIVTLVAQYQVELFWIGLIANGAGILYIGNKVLKFSAAHARTEPPAVAQA